MTAEAIVITKTDLYRERPQFFRAGRKPELVDLPEAPFLVVDGAGSPDDTFFQEAIGALYSVAYTMKFEGKKTGRDFKVPTFEGAWWSEGDEPLPREQWHWQLHMMMPDFIHDAAVEAALKQLEAKGRSPEVPVRLERLHQGLCVQLMHVGPYATEPESIEKMKAFIAENGLRARGPHHEVYLSDPRRARPETMKTLLKQPVDRVAANDPMEHHGLRDAFRSAESLISSRP